MKGVNEMIKKEFLISKKAETDLFQRRPECSIPLGDCL